jgi:N-acetylmuramoyl-L-alanine amidase
MHAIIMFHFLLHIRFRLVALMLMTLLMVPCRLVSAAPSAIVRQTTVPLAVTTGNDQGYTINVLALRKADGLMIDLESMSRALRLSYRKEQGSLVVEESFGMPGSICTVMADNNFVRVLSRDPDRPKRIIQLQSSPLLMQSRIWLPIKQACRLFALWLDREVVYNPASGQIRVSIVKKFWGESTGTIGIVNNEEELVPGGTVRPFELAKTEITGIEVKNLANGALISFFASGVAAPASLVTLNAEGYTYFSVENASCDINALTKAYSRGVVRSIIPKQSATGGLQFTIALDNRSFVINSVEFQRDKNKNSYLIAVRSNADVEGIRKKEKEQQIAQVLNRDVEKWKLNTIVLDAGHGGKDPGAIGGNGTSEKDVALNIVRDLGMFITQQWPDVRVIYTRKDDTFIPLHQRGKIANQSGGKLFISVHCNASPNRNARGSEVYILGPHKTKAALDIAMFENSVIRQEADDASAYKGFSEEYLIMSSMAQSSFARQSTSLAQHILNPVNRQSAYNSRGVRQAGFMVLWTPSMPSALVEVGYLSNIGEERILRDRQEQAKIAYGIFQGLQTYRKNYETSSMAAMER